MNHVMKKIGFGAALSIMALAPAAEADEFKLSNNQRIACSRGLAPGKLNTATCKSYAYGKDGKTLSYKMGTNNAGTLLKGAKKVPKGTLFFIGTNGQLYMRSGPYLEGDGSFMFGSN